jgi:glycosyltransferase involved in cell wall biosynthesis
MEKNTITDKLKIKRRVLFFSSVKDLELFKITGFYATDIKILEDLNCRVVVSNSYIDFLKFWNYDISFIYFWTKGFFPAVISKIFNKSVIFTGGIDRLDKNFNKSKFDYFLKKYFFKLCTIFSDANIIVSNSDIHNIKLTNFSVNNLQHIPHVLDFNSYAYNGENKENIISTVVWMEGSEINVIRKGVDKMLYVFKDFKKLNPSFKLVMIGSKGVGTEYLIEIAKKLNILDDIYFTGRVDEKEKISILKKSKFYFQLSIYEGFGIAALEALASGNIVFHSGAGGLKDSIGDRGVLIEDTNKYDEIANKLNEINDSYDTLYLKQVLDGVDYVKNNFSYSVRLEGIKEVISSL